jgi:hypothetical protein
MAREMGRRRVHILARLRGGHGLWLVQAFEEGETASAIPVDQVLIKEGDESKALMLSAGKFWFRTIEPDGIVIGEARPLKLK